MRNHDSIFKRTVGDVLSDPKRSEGFVAYRPLEEKEISSNGYAIKSLSQVVCDFLKETEKREEQKQKMNIELAIMRRLQKDPKYIV